jgi:hypothetical protein
VFFIPTGVNIVPASDVRQPELPTPAPFSPFGAMTNTPIDEPVQPQDVQTDMALQPDEAQAVTVNEPPAGLPEATADVPQPPDPDPPDELNEVWVQPQSTADYFDQKTTVRAAELTEAARLLELSQWQKKVKNNGRAKGSEFTASHLPDGVQAYIRYALKDMTHITPKDIFNKARELLAEEMIAEDAAQSWRRYDVLMEDVGDAWLSGYMRKVWSQIEALPTEAITTDTVATILENDQDILREAWVGTPEAPGVIYQLMLAGMQAGQDAIVEGASMKPPSLKAITLEIDWTLLSREAYDYVRQYVSQLIDRVNMTTTDAVQITIAEWIETGGTLDQLKQQLEPIFRNAERAASIAQTETTRA